MIRLLVSDLDGTFLMSEAVDGSFVSKENMEAMKRFRAAGGTFVTCSGRHHEYSYSLMEELGFEFDMIGTNGATLIHKNHLIEHNHPQRHIVREVVSELTKEEYRNELEVVGVDLSFTYILGHGKKSWCMPDFAKMMENGIIGGVSEMCLEDWLNDRKKPDITSLSVTIQDGSKLYGWIDRLRAMFDKYFDIYASGERYIEMMRPGINKGHGVRSMMKIYGLEEHEIAVVGDNQNDISMFFTTSNSFVMSSATDAVKKYANYTVDSVAQAIDIIMKKNDAEKASKIG